MFTNEKKTCSFTVFRVFIVLLFSVSDESGKKNETSISFNIDENEQLIHLYGRKIASRSVLQLENSIILPEIQHYHQSIVANTQDKIYWYYIKNSCNISLSSLKLAMYLRQCLGWFVLVDRP